MNIHCWLFASLLLATCSLAASAEDELERQMEQGIVVDLRDPVFENGVLSTTQGGVVTTHDLRIQAQKVIYTHKKIKDQQVFSLEASGDLIVESGGRAIIGDTLQYDFLTQTGTVDNARTGTGVWYLQGEQVLIKPDGKFVISNASVSTCDRLHKDWAISSKEITIDDNNVLFASNVKFNWIDIPVFWLPVYKTSLEAFDESPISYRFGFGGSQGPRVRTRYQFFRWDEWDFSLLLDYLIKRGVGGGVESNYESRDGLTTFSARNYHANDISVFKKSRRHRYRHEGYGHTSFYDGQYEIDLQYDKLSDEDMASDYHDRDFNYVTPRTTEIQARRYDSCWIAGGITRVRLNDFQTVKQELPTFWVSVRPISLGNTGVIWENKGSAGYLHYRFDDELPALKSFHSSREEIRSTLYRPFHLWKVTLLPEATFVGIHTSESPTGGGRGQAIGVFSGEITTHLTRSKGSYSQVIRPYIAGKYVTNPAHTPNHVYIYDINDGWDELKMVTLGCESVFMSERRGFQERVFGASVWTHAFIDMGTIDHVAPRVYLDGFWNICTSARAVLDTAWDFDRHSLDHANCTIEWAPTEALAFSTEYRHRGDFSWRKVDSENFMVDAFRTEESLRLSKLSDRRDSVLFKFFYRISPNWVLEGKSRHGWGREAPTQDDYHDLDLDLTTHVSCNWYLTTSYQHRQSDDRFSFNVDLKDDRPDKKNLYRTHLYR